MIKPAKSTPFPVTMPRLGLGTWRLGERASQREIEIASVQHAIQLGYRLIDTAEMYGEGGAETIVGQALEKCLRDRVVQREAMFIVSKVYPHNAGRESVETACKRSLDRLRTDYLDLYLLHWRGDYPLGETIAGFERLVQQGRIRRWGVSNFDCADMAELVTLAGGQGCAVNQVYFSLGEQGASFSLLPWLREHDIMTMAYSPIDQGSLATAAALQPVADRHRVSPAQVALAWVLGRPGMVAIPKAVQWDHLQQNLAAAELVLDDVDLREIEHSFPAPLRKHPLAMI